jgi:hypothetical protein
MRHLSPTRMVSPVSLSPPAIRMVPSFNAVDRMI